MVNGGNINNIRTNWFLSGPTPSLTRRRLHEDIFRMPNISKTTTYNPYLPPKDWKVMLVLLYHRKGFGSLPFILRMSHCPSAKTIPFGSDDVQNKNQNQIQPEAAPRAHAQRKIP